jgi:hypothetical protein
VGRVCESRVDAALEQNREYDPRKRQVSGCVGSCSNFPPPSERRHGRQGTKALVKTLQVGDRRSPLTTRRMSRIAKGSLLQGPLFLKALAPDSQKRRSPVPVQNCQPCSQGVRANVGAFLPEGFSCATAST